MTAPSSSPPPAYPPPAYPPLPRTRLPFVAAFVAAGVCFALSFLLLVAGLTAPSLALVYLSIAASLLWLPLLVVGVVLAVVDSRR